MVKGKFVPVLN